MSDRLFVAEAPLRHEAREVRGGFVDIEGERFYRIENVEAMAPFLMSLASPSDHWLFLSSNGGLTAGRRDPDHALFPYVTDDRIHDSLEHTGPRTILRVRRGGRTLLWEPFAGRHAGLYRITRHLAKSAYGNKVVLEEVNEDLELACLATWMTSERFGFVRRVELQNRGAAGVEVELLDGLQDLLPHGITRQFQLEFSTLGDGYKDNELDEESGLGLYRLSSIPTDKAEPSEALAVTTVWCDGLPPGTRLLSSTQLEAFRRGEGLVAERRLRGRRGAYFAHARLTLAPRTASVWRIVADVDQDAADVAELRRLLKGGRSLAAELDADVALGTQKLVGIVANADGLQVSRDEPAAWRHFSNTLFNVMRGGTPDADYTIERADFVSFVETANRALARRHAARLAALPARLEHGSPRGRDTRRPGIPTSNASARSTCRSPSAGATATPAGPGTSSRSRSRTSAAQQGPRPTRATGATSSRTGRRWPTRYPGFLEGMIAKFLDASTADGYNPYRVTRDGFDWEVLDPHDPWSNIGYWGDHQIIYLLKLLELAERVRPGVLTELLARGVS